MRVRPVGATHPPAGRTAGPVGASAAAPDRRYHGVPADVRGGGARAGRAEIDALLRSLVLVLLDELALLRSAPRVATDRVRDAEVLRAIRAGAVAGALALPDEVSLAQLAESVGDPWRAVLDGQRSALGTAAGGIGSAGLPASLSAFLA